MQQPETYDEWDDFQTASLDRSIENVSGFVAVIEQIRRSGQPILELPKGASPLNVWYRGQPDSRMRPVPAINRKPHSNVQANEAAVVALFSSLNAHRLPPAATPFDKLCEMQVYGVPTRLLDWTLNPLMALYFAVTDSPNRDGAVYVLNPLLLNHRNGLFARNAIYPHDSFDVLIRSAVALSHTLPYLLEKLAEILSHAPLHEVKSECRRKIEDIAAATPATLKRLLAPVAVYPRAVSDQLRGPSALFTLHGRKKLKLSLPPDPPGSAPQPPSVLKIIIPQDRKADIRSQLSYLGITEASVFPEKENSYSTIKGMLGL